MNNENKQIQKQTLRGNILLLGDASVGKTSLLCRYLFNTFQAELLSTIGLVNSIKDFTFDDRIFKVNFFDTAGQERYNSLCGSWLHKSNGVMLIFDITNEDSFHRIKYWLHQIQQYLDQDIPKVLIANKSDLEDERIVSMVDCAILANEIKCSYEEVSAKTGNNVVNSVERFVRQVFKAMLIRDDDYEEMKFNLNKKNDLMYHNQFNQNTCCTQ